MSQLFAIKKIHLFLKAVLLSFVEIRVHRGYPDVKAVPESFLCKISWVFFSSITINDVPRGAPSLSRQGIGNKSLFFLKKIVVLPLGLKKGNHTSKFYSKQNLNVAIFLKGHE
jgi:hypothetical protein